ncbi:MAG: hypothetical protein WD939_06220 [Dehalococcoidia bacterium]
MSGRQPIVKRADLALAFWAIVLGLGAAAAFGAYRAVSVDGEDTGGRFVEFAANAGWPGVLILAAVAAVVWFGWKANLD